MFFSQKVENVPKLSDQELVIPSWRYRNYDYRGVYTPVTNRRGNKTRNDHARHSSLPRSHNAWPADDRKEESEKVNKVENHL